jgi:hypothetical protein
MPIIIHEFEVITAPPAPAANEAVVSEPAAASAGLRPEDIEAIWQQQQARAERLRAD